MFTALIAGSTGMTGRLLTQQILESPRYDLVYVLVRKAGTQRHPKLHEIVFDFDHPADLIPAADHVFCCLGTTIAKAGSKEAFANVDKEYPLMLARESFRKGASLFAIVTAGGANPNSMIFYNRIKGETEQALAEIGFPHLGIFRPSMLLGERGERRPTERAGQLVMQWLDFLIPARYKAIDAAKVARAMLLFAEHPEKGIRIVESDDMRA